MQRSIKALPSVVRIPLKLLASAGFATVTIVLCVLVLAWSTFLVSRYGLTATEYGVYQSWWFALLLLLLGINVIAATIAKLPWRRSQTGFLVVHAGILVLLVGCWLTREYGVNGQLGVPEGATSSLVMENSQHFQLQIADLSGEKETKIFKIPFRPGPFNWSDYDDQLTWFPWRWAGRSCGTIYDNPQEGVKLEVLDYMSDSELVPVPELVLDTRPVGGRMKGAMDEGETDKDLMELILSVRSMSSHGVMQGRTLMIGSQYQFPTGESVSFRFVDSKAAVRAFLNASPKPPLGPLGQIILQVVEDPDSPPTVYRFSLAEMLKEEGMIAIGDTSLQVQVTQFIPSRMKARLAIYDTEKPSVRPRIIILKALEPIFDMQDPTGEVIGSFWFSAFSDAEEPGDTKPKKLKKSTKPKKSKKSKKSKKDDDAAEVAFLDALHKIMEAQPQAIVDADITMAKIRRLFVTAKMPRVDLIQGPGGVLQGKGEAKTEVSTSKDKPEPSKVSPRLYIREWDGRRITSAGLFDPKAKKIKWFAKSGRPLLVDVVRYVPADPPSEMVRAISFETNVPDKKKKVQRAHRVQVRLTVGDMSETFWLTDPSSSDDPSQLRKTVIDKNRSVSIALRRDEIGLGFGVHLDDFTVEYSPGSAMPTRFASQVDFVHLPNSKSDKKADQIYEKDVIIEGNHPAAFKDPSNGRVYRFFQNRYEGPFRPGHPDFDRFVGGDQKRDSLYFSYFGVAYDPGRFWKYAGCFMIIFGIAIMYYMKAYFFRRFSDRMNH